MSRADLATLNRVVEVVLPRGGMIMGVVEGYFDESGDLNAGPRVFAVSGYFITSDEAVEMNARWAEVLSEYDLPYFHMVECAGGSGVFEGISKDNRTELVKRLIALIKRHTIEGFSAICVGADFKPSDQYPDAYSFGVAACVTAVRSFLEVNRVAGQTAYFFEAGHKGSGRAYNLIADALGQTGAPLTFAGKREAPLLQAADLLAWQTTKYVKDRISGARPPRKDFESLMEHGHTFAYTSFDEGGKSTMAFELWPLRRRTQSTEAFVRDDSGPLPIMREEGDERPILAVQAALGWRPAPAHMLYLGFEALDGRKEFSLLFDQARLFETLLMVLDAQRAYAGHDGLAVITPEAVTLTPHDEEVVVSITLHGDGRFGLRLPKPMASALLSEIAAALNDDA